MFVYRFSRVHPFVDGLGYAQQNPATGMGAYHGAEMAYAYGTLDVLNRFAKTRAWSEEDRRYARGAMISYWVNFARTGNPNGEGLPAWPVLQARQRAGRCCSARRLRRVRCPNKAQLDFFFDRN